MGSSTSLFVAVRRVSHYLCAVGATLCLIVCTACSDAPRKALPDEGDPPSHASAPQSVHRPALGAGVDFSETRSFRRCVTTPMGNPRPGFAGRLYRELAVQDRNALNSALDVDASVSAKGLWGGASGSASYFKNVQMTSDNFYWLVHADYRLLDQGIDTGADDFRLTDEAQKILAGPGGLKAFYEACGEYFYTGYRLGAQYALLYEFQSSESTTVERIKTAASYEGLGMEAKASFAKMIEMAQKASVLTVHAAGQGGGNRLRTYATNPLELEAQLAILRDDLYNHHLGVETQWFVGDYNMFAEVQAAKAQADANASHPGVDKLAKEHGLASLYQLHASNVDHQKRLMASLEKSSGPEPLFVYRPEKRRALRALVRQLDERTEAVRKLAKQCLFDAQDSCDLASLRDDPWDAAQDAGLLVPDEDLAGLQGWALHMAQRRSGTSLLDFVGRAPEGGRPVVFGTEFSVADTPIGIVARSDEGPDAATVIGWATIVRDPAHGQLRPNVCVNNYAEVCRLRLVRTGASGASHPTALKLQLSLFDPFGFVVKTIDFPAEP